MAPEAAPQDANPISNAAQGASRQNRQRIQDDITKILQDMRSKKPTLDVVHDILSDHRLKQFAHMTSSCRQSAFHNQSQLRGARPWR